jgi:hypothetical protein
VNQCPSATKGALHAPASEHLDQIGHESSVINGKVNHEKITIQSPGLIAAAARTAFVGPATACVHSWPPADT